MRNTILLVILGILLLLAAGFYFSQIKSLIFDSGIPGDDQAEFKTIRGEVLDVALSAKVIIAKDENNQEINLALVPEAKLFDDNENIVDLRFFQRGFKIEAQGERKDSGTIVVSEIRALAVPNIIVLSPSPDD